MTRFWPDGHAIDMRLDAAGQPVRFVWQGRSHRLQRIHQRWQVDTDWWREEGRVWRNYLALITTDGLFCVIYFDILTQSWFLEKLYD